MKSLALISVSILLAQLFALPCRAADLLVDINLKEMASPEKTEPGFTALQVAFGGELNPSVTVGGVSLTLDGEWGGRDRVMPTNFGDFTENLLLRDCAFPNTTTQNPATVTIAGLTATTQYDMSVWSYEGGPYVWDLFANGALVKEDFAQGMVPPLDNDDQRIDFQATSDASGKVVLAFSNIAPLVTYPEYRVNAFRVINAITGGGGNNGDYNGNGFVDAADYVVWRSTLNDPVQNGTGADGNGDGTINPADYDHWKALFGTAVGSGTANLVVVAVPEPVTSWMLVAAAIAVFRLRRK